MPPIVHRKRATVCVAAAILAVGCLLPTNRSGELKIEVLTEIPLLFVGDTLRLDPRLVDETGTAIANAVMDYYSGDPAVVTFAEGGLLQALGEGVAEVTVRATQFGNVEPVTMTAVVLRGIAILSLTPRDTVRFGDILTIEGSGLDTAGLAVLSIGGVAPTVRSFVPGDIEDPSSYDSLSLWVPPPAPYSSDLVLVRRVGGSALRSLTVLQQDVFEPNDIEPYAFGVVNDPIVNPALALEAATNLESFSIDWYRAQIGADGITIVFSFPGGSAFDFGIGPAAFEVLSPRTNMLGPPAWSISANTFGYCQEKSFFFFNLADRDSTLFALKEVPAGDGAPRNVIDMVVSPTVFPFQATPYKLEIRPGYLTPLLPDSSEENDFCTAATPLPLDGDSLDLNFDHGMDLDWFKFTIGDSAAAVPRGTRRAFVIVDETEPNDDKGSADTVRLGDQARGSIDPAGDIDYYGFRVDTIMTLDLDVDAAVMGSLLDPTLTLFDSLGNQLAFNDDANGLDSRIQFRAAPGQYFVAVAAFAGRGGANYGYILQFDNVDVSGASSLVIDLTSDSPVVTPHMTLFEVPDEVVTFELQIVAEAFCFSCQGPEGTRNALFARVSAGEYLLLITSVFGDRSDYTLRARANLLSGAGGPAQILAPEASPHSKDHLRNPYKSGRSRPSRR